MILWANSAQKLQIKQLSEYRQDQIMPYPSMTQVCALWKFIEEKIKAVFTSEYSRLHPI